MSQFQGTLNGSGFSNIQTLVGSNATIDTLTGINQNNNWMINSLDSGSVAETASSPTDTVNFSGMENLVGGSDNDRFIFTDNGSISGLIDGGGHVDGDVIDYSLLTSVNLTLSDAFSGVTNVEIIQGNNSDSTLIGDNILERLDNYWR